MYRNFLLFKIFFGLVVFSSNLFSGEDSSFVTVEKWSYKWSQLMIVDRLMLITILGFGYSSSLSLNRGFDMPPSFCDRVCQMIWIKSPDFGNLIWLTWKPNWLFDVDIELDKNLWSLDWYLSELEDENFFVIIEKKRPLKRVFGSVLGF